MSEKEKVNTLKPVFFGIVGSGDVQVVLFAMKQHKNYSTMYLGHAFSPDFLTVDISNQKVYPCITTDGKHYGIVVQGNKFFWWDYNSIGEEVPSATLEDRGADISPRPLPGDDQYQNFYDLFVSVVTLSNGKKGWFFSRPSAIRANNQIAIWTEWNTKEDIWAYAGGTPQHGVPFFGQGGGIIIKEGSEDSPQYALYHDSNNIEHNITIIDEMKFPIFKTDVTWTGGAEENPPISYEVISSSAHEKTCRITNLSPVPIKIGSAWVNPHNSVTQKIKGILDPWGGGDKFLLSVQFKCWFRTWSTNI